MTRVVHGEALCYSCDMRLIWVLAGVFLAFNAHASLLFHRRDFFGCLSALAASPIALSPSRELTRSKRYLITMAQANLPVSPSLLETMGNFALKYGARVLVIPIGNDKSLPKNIFESDRFELFTPQAVLGTGMTVSLHLHSARGESGQPALPYSPGHLHVVANAKVHSFNVRRQEANGEEEPMVVASTGTLNDIVPDIHDRSLSAISVPEAGGVLLSWDPSQPDSRVQWRQVRFLFSHEHGSYSSAVVDGE